MGDLIKPKPIFMQEITGSTLFPNIQDTITLFYSICLYNWEFKKGHNKESIHVEDCNINLLGKMSKILEYRDQDPEC